VVQGIGARRGYAALAAAAIWTLASTAPAAGAVERAPRIDAKAWVLVDARTGERIAGHAAGKRLPIASATKLMTAYVALKRLPLHKRLAAAPYDPGPAETVAGLRAGERLTVRDLLYALVLPSANDAAVTLARGVSGSVGGFVRTMNRTAAALGLVHTRYRNPVGLDQPGSGSSAGDLASLTLRLLERPAFRRIADSPRAVLRSGDRRRRIVSRNLLLSRVPWISGVKTGHTLEAGYVLVGSARMRGTELVSVVLGTASEASRDAQTLRLLGYGFSLFRPRTPVSLDQEVAAPGVRYDNGRLPLLAARTLTVGARRGQRVATRVEAPGEVEGPIQKGQRLGRVIVTVDGREIGSAPLVAGRSLPPPTPLSKLRARLPDTLILLAAAAIVIVMGAALAVRARRPPRSRTR
jgi:serine-type D-Ala-D-Ala carboxypeptidase (penicillin-binding protein 5/6)